MRMYDIIEAKKLGKILTAEQIKFWIQGVVAGTIPEYQTSALLMAILLKGMTDEETYFLTIAMLESGDKVDLEGIVGTTVDKHSTGGVGDSASFVVLPLAASFGLKVAKMSGRGLGHTGGTIDKLEAIDGMRVELSISDIRKQVEDIGICIAGQTSSLVPADKILYALRDVTATVDSIPLIASSIMSKKLAGGNDIIVLDVKFGNGAFMKTKHEAAKLAKAMVDIGNRAGKRVSAVITNMNEPLDQYIGNSLELLGALEVLKGGKGKLYEVSKALVKEMLMLSGIADNDSYGDSLVDNHISSGQALDKFRELIAYQGGDTSFIEDTSKLMRVRYKFDIISPKTGYIKSVNTSKLGIVAGLMGAGRLTKEDTIDHYVGIKVCARIGDFVEEGDILATVFYNDYDKLVRVEDIASSFKFSSSAVATPELIYKIIR